MRIFWGREVALGGLLGVRGVEQRFRLERSGIVPITLYLTTGAKRLRREKGLIFVGIWLDQCHAPL